MLTFQVDQSSVSESKPNLESIVGLTVIEVEVQAS